MIDQQLIQTGTGFRVENTVLDYETGEAPEFIDITSEVSRTVQRSGIENGLAVIFSMHTTAAIKINEGEPELLKDMSRFLREIAPHDAEYNHNNFDVRTVNMEEDECPNGHSHCQHLMLSASETLPVVDGRLQLGRWQRIFLVELDRPKSRRVTVQIVGV